MAKSAFQYMYDVYGNTYLDAYNNIPHVGHSHPKVVEAAPNLAKLIKNELRDKNILINTDGPFDNVIKTKPALCFTKENAQQVTDRIYEVLKKYHNKN